MPESTFQLLRGTAFLASFALVYLLQSLLPQRPLSRPVPRNWRQNATLGAINTVVVGVACGACLMTAARFSEARGWGMLRLTRLPDGAAILASILALDLVVWVWHLANHRVGWLWRFHQVHHSDADLDLSSS